MKGFLCHGSIPLAGPAAAVGEHSKMADVTKCGGTPLPEDRTSCLSYRLRVNGVKQGAASSA